MLPAGAEIAAQGVMLAQKQMYFAANNAAGANNIAGKKMTLVTTDLFYTEMPGVGVEFTDPIPASYPQQGHGSRVQGVAYDFTQGDFKNTKQPLDVAINGLGFMGVTLPDGTKAYTRAGNLLVNKNRYITTRQGLLIDGLSQIPTNVDINTIKIDVYGNVTALASDNITVQNFGTISLYTFDDVEGLKMLGNSLYQETDLSGTAQQVAAATYGSGEFQQGYLEQSNVNIMNEITNVTAAQLSWQLSYKIYNIICDTSKELTKA